MAESPRMVLLSTALMLAITVVAQENKSGTLPPGVFGCGTPESPVATDFQERPTMEFFAPVEPRTPGADWKHRVFEGFGASAHGFTAVEFLLEPQQPTSAPWTATDDELSVTTAHLYVKLLTGPGQAATW